MCDADRFTWVVGGMVSVAEDRQAILGRLLTLPGAAIEGLRGLLPLPLSRLRRTPLHGQPPQPTWPTASVAATTQQHRPADEPRLRLPRGRRTARAMVAKPPPASRQIEGLSDGSVRRP